jgi:hypothetical protein
VTLDVNPPMGVTVSVDGQSARPVNTGDALSLDSRGHVLTFSCPVCADIRLPVAPGERNDTLRVSVPVKPATLVVEGDLGKTYQLAQHPEISIRPGTNTVPLKSAYERVTVREIETGAAVPARLEAGKTVHATFE